MSSLKIKAPKVHLHFRDDKAIFTAVPPLLPHRFVRPASGSLPGKPCVTITGRTGAPYCFVQAFCSGVRPLFLRVIGLHQPPTLCRAAREKLSSVTAFMRSIVSKFRFLSRAGRAFALYFPCLYDLGGFGPKSEHLTAFRFFIPPRSDSNTAAGRRRGPPRRSRNTVRRTPHPEPGRRPPGCPRRSRW